MTTPTKTETKMEIARIEVRSDVYEVPHWEDSSPIGHLAFYVVAVLVGGLTFRHRSVFTTEVLGRVGADAAAGRLADRVQAAVDAGSWAGPVDSAHWEETYPEYGSPAYEAADADGSNLAWERRAEGAL